MALGKHAVTWRGLQVESVDICMRRRFNGGITIAASSLTRQHITLKHRDLLSAARSQRVEAYSVSEFV